MRPLSRLGVVLQPVHQDVQAQPDHVYKVPVPSGTFKAEMLVRCEVAFLQTQGDHQQHQHTQEHVKTVKTCEHVKRRTIHTRGELEVHVAVGMGVFIALHKQEHHAQQHREPHELDRGVALVLNQRVVRDRQRHARCQQQGGVDGGQPERCHHLEGLNDACR